MLAYAVWWEHTDDPNREAEATTGNCTGPTREGLPTTVRDDSDGTRDSWFKSNRTPL